MSDKTYISEQGLQKLEQELKYLKTEKRREIADRIQTAKDLGDLSENAEYAEAKDDLAFNEGRIIELEELLRSAVVVEYGKKQSRTNFVQIGNKIKIKDQESGDIIEYEIVGSCEADPLNSRISNESPLGKAFLNKKQGDEVEIVLPKKTVKYKIIEIF
ncbi:MAG: transcription elongation factor GreA [Patescibacteria group bacterium]